MMNALKNLQSDSELNRFLSYLSCLLNYLKNKTKMKNYIVLLISNDYKAKNMKSFLSC